MSLPLFPFSTACCYVKFYHHCINYKVLKCVTDENKSLKLVDAPVSGGVKRAADGTLTVMSSLSNSFLMNNFLIK